MKPDFECPSCGSRNISLSEEIEALQERVVSLENELENIMDRKVYADDQEVLI